MKYQYDLQEPNFLIKNIDIQNVVRPRNYKHSFQQGRAKNAFIYVVRGALRESFLEGASIEGKVGELLFIPCGEASTCVYLEDETDIRIVQFDLISGDLPSYLRAPVKLSLPDAGELIEAFFAPLKSHTVRHPFYYRSCFYRLLWRIDEACFQIPPKYKRLQAALSEMTEGFAENQPITYYAALCDMSEVNFRRLFKEYMGMSPIEYRNGLRLENARNMLQSAEFNVSEAARSSGFSNLSFFIRLYKKRFGHTPKKE